MVGPISHLLNQIIQTKTQDLSKEWAYESIEDSVQQLAGIYKNKKITTSHNVLPRL